MISTQNGASLKVIKGNTVNLCIQVCITSKFSLFIADVKKSGKVSPGMVALLKITIGHHWFQFTSCSCTGQNNSKVCPFVYCGINCYCFHFFSATALLDGMSIDIGTSSMLVMSSSADFNWVKSFWTEVLNVSNLFSQSSGGFYQTVLCAWNARLFHGNNSSLEFDCYHWNCTVIELSERTQLARFSTKVGHLAFLPQRSCFLRFIFVNFSFTGLQWRTIFSLQLYSLSTDLLSCCSLANFITSNWKLALNNFRLGIMRIIEKL